MKLRNFYIICSFCFIFFFVGKSFIFSQTEKNSVKRVCGKAFGGEATLVFEDPLKSKMLRGKVVIIGDSDYLVAHAKVLITDNKYNEVFQKTVTDKNGHFSFPNSPKGTHYIFVCKEGYNNTQAKIKISQKKGTQNYVTLELNVP